MTSNTLLHFLELGAARKTGAPGLHRVLEIVDVFGGFGVVILIALCMPQVASSQTAHILIFLLPTIHILRRSFQFFLSFRGVQQRSG